MKKPSRFLRLIGVAGLLATLLAGVFATPIVYAQPDPDPSDDGTIGDIWDGTDPYLELDEGGIYFPWVGNDDESTGLGPADTSVSVMNISDEPAVAFAFVGSHDTAELPDTGEWDVVGPFFLAPWASKTFTAAQLGIAEGTGAPVAFSGYNYLMNATVCEYDLGGTLAAGNDVNINDRCTDYEVFVGSDDDDRSDPDLCRVDNSNGDRTNNYQGIYDGPGGLNNDGDCEDAEGGNAGGVVAETTTLGGYAKQAVDGETLPYTTGADSSVSGYNSVGGFELGEFDDWYFPIAQTNCGPGGCWNTILRIANFGQAVDGEIGHVGSAAVTARFFPADDAQGSLDTGFQLQALVNTGDVWNIDISDYVPEGWVGSVHVYSDSAIFAMADRVKVGYGAWITNTASNAPYTDDNNVAGALGDYVLYAPDVRLDFFGWNTGINVANLVNEDNNVNIQYFNLYGNAPSTLTRRLAPQGMTYFYDPSQAPQDNSVQDPGSDVNADVIGSALIFSDYPVAVAVDATKYPESTTSEDPNIFQAMSYSATGNVYTTQAFPLVQKGNATDGMGATSGINIMNPNATVAQATVWWVNPSGFGADNFGTSAVAIPGFANGFVYTMTQGNLPNGFYGSAVLTSTVPVAAVTTQVDYQVEWDGTAVWLGYNPCGFYRDNGDIYDDGATYSDHFDGICYFGDPFAQGGQSVTKTFVDDAGETVSGIYAKLYNEAAWEHENGNEAFPGIDWTAEGYSDVNGAIHWSNVPVGKYYLEVDTWGMYDCEFFGCVETIVVNEGDDLGGIELTNFIDRILPVKTFVAGADANGMEVCLVEDADANGEMDDAEYEVYCAVLGPAADEAVTIAAIEGIEPGWYFVVANGGIENEPVAGFNSPAFEPYIEFFYLGEVVENDLTGLINGVEGNIQKVITLPDDLCEANDEANLAGVLDICPDVEISGSILITGPNGFEVEGNVQTAYAPSVGPNDEPSFVLTDFNVPVGGPYTIVENLVITYDLDGPGGDDPVSFPYNPVLTEAVDGQVVCEEWDDLSSACDASPDDPMIYVYENMTTRVFNDLTDIIEGQLDVFVRDDDSDEPLEDALVCVYDESVAPAELVACDFTNGDGEAEFTLGEGFYSLTAGAFNHETDGSGVFFYWPAADANNGSGMDDEIDDQDPWGSIYMALDPQAAILGVQLEALPNPGAQLQGSPLEGYEVRVYLRDPILDDSMFCGGETLVAVDSTDSTGYVEFSLANDVEYCVSTYDVIFDYAQSPVETGNWYPGAATPFEPFDVEGDEDLVFEVISGGQDD